MSEQKKSAIESYYEGRKEYSIIGLTGIAGSGCSYLAGVMGLSKDKFLECVRKPQQILESEVFENGDPVVDNEQLFVQGGNQNDEQLGRLIFKRKYEACYNLISARYTPYRVIKYTHVLWLYVLIYLRKEGGENWSVEYLRDCLYIILNDKYRPSIHDDVDVDFKQASGYTKDKRAKEIVDILNGFDQWDALVAEVGALSSSYLTEDLRSSRISYEDKEKLCGFFFGNETLHAFIKYIINVLAQKDYYSSCLMYHKMATQIRTSGEMLGEAVKVAKEPRDDYKNLYVIVRLINLIIKGLPAEADRRIVIDSIRNSSEALYLRERYHGFYLVCVNNEFFRANISDKVKSVLSEKYNEERDNEYIDASVDRITDLAGIERDKKDFDMGKLTSPDTERVVELAEIHLVSDYGKVKHEEEEKNPAHFSSLYEQWMKFAALMLHPGLITPSAEERCMMIAYTAKLNSGCLSRQVGAAITNKDNSVRSIGWNEVPHGQVSCALRELPHLHDKEDKCHKCVFSEFERSVTEQYKDSKKTFSTHEIESFADAKELRDGFGGLPYSYCFRDLHNGFSGEKNQVFTRSLHAEENAILQMAKYGGEGLKDGIIYVTASPCELCSKKLYQIGVRRIVFIDPYPGIARQQIIHAGFKQPALKMFEGAFGITYFKLYQPFLAYKDELAIRTGGKNKPPKPESKDTKLLKVILDKMGVEYKENYSEKELEEIMGKMTKRE